MENAEQNPAPGKLLRQKVDQAVLEREGACAILRFAWAFETKKHLHVWQQSPRAPPR